MKNPAATLTTLRSQAAQTSAEYSVMLALILLAVVAAVAVLNSAVLDVLGRVAGVLG